MTYLQDWEDSASSVNGLTTSEKNKMLLSKETLEGIRITGIDLHAHMYARTDLIIFIMLYIVNSFVEMTRYLLSLNPSSYLLSEKISQDPLEHYFGKQRACGGRNE